MGRLNDDRLGLSPEEVRRLRAEQRARLEANRRKAAASWATKPHSIGQTRRSYYWVYVYCGRCQRCAIFPLVPLIVRWGPDASLDRLRRAARCMTCGHKGATLSFSNSARPDAPWQPMYESGRWTGNEVPAPTHELADKASGFRGEIDWHPDLGALNFDAMCNAYSMTRSRDEIRGLFRVPDNRTAQITPRAEIWPGYDAPVVRLATDGEREIVNMSFGFPLIRKGYAPKRVSNVRDDTAREKWFWRESYERRRCLVPATSYLDPDSNKPVAWHWFALEPAEDRPMFGCPGVWKRYVGQVKKGEPDVDIEVFSFMTTLPNSLTASINHERMPVIFTEDHEFETWLTGTPDEAHALVRTFEAERMRIVQSGKKGPDLLGATVSF